MANTERNKQAVARLFEAFRAGDVEAFDELIVEDCVQHNPQAGNGLQAVGTDEYRGRHPQIPGPGDDGYLDWLGKTRSLRRH